MTPTKHSLVVYGASGAGRRVVDIALDMLDADPDVPFDAVEVIDDSPTTVNLERLRRTGVRYLGTSESWLRGAQHAYFSIGVGDTTLRRELARKLTAAGHTPATLVAPSAHISRSAVLGPGCVISPGVDLSANVELGRFVHVMANASVSHDVVLSDFVNVNPGAVIAGSCRVETGATIGAGAVVLQGLRVGHHSTVGAGACVVHDVPSDSVVKGVPAR